MCEAGTLCQAANTVMVAEADTVTASVRPPMATRPTPRKPRAPKAAADPVAAETAAPTLPASPAALPELKRQELLAEVARRTEIRRNVARPVLEAALAVIGEALAEGRDLNLAPLGKLKVNRMRAAGTGRVIVARIRQGAKGADADRGEDDAGMKEEVAEPSE